MAKKIEYKKLPPAFKIKLIKALESGKYPKGEGYLVTEGYNNKEDETELQFCCIGVAGRICGVPVDKMIDIELFDSEYYGNNELKKFRVPSALKNVIGSRDHDDAPTITKLTDLNDKSKSFKPVINFIKKYL